MERGPSSVAIDKKVGLFADLLAGTARRPLKERDVCTGPALPHTALVQRLEGRAEQIHRPIESCSPVTTPGGLSETAPQRGKARGDLFPGPLGPVAGALAWDTGLFEALGPFPQALGALKVRGLRPEVLADHTGRPGLEGRRNLGRLLVASPIAGEEARECCARPGWQDPLREPRPERCKKR